MNHLRWRLNDPAEERVERWTRVHKVQTLDDERTLCGLTIPLAYVIDYDDQISDGAPVCDHCKVAARRLMRGAK